MTLKNKFFAISKYCRVSPHKVSKILDKIRGKSYKEALSILEYMPQKSGLAVWKALRSAASSASYTSKIEKENLYILLAWIGKGPILKRLQPRAKGKAYKIEKKFSHISITLSHR